MDVTTQWLTFWQNIFYTNDKGDDCISSLHTHRLTLNSFLNLVDPQTFNTRSTKKKHLHLLAFAGKWTKMQFAAKNECRLFIVFLYIDVCACTQACTNLPS